MARASSPLLHVESVITRVKPHGTFIFWLFRNQRQKLSRMSLFPALNRQTKKTGTAKTKSSNLFSPAVPFLTSWHSLVEVNTFPKPSPKTVGKTDSPVVVPSPSIPQLGPFYNVHSQEWNQKIYLSALIFILTWVTQSGDTWILRMIPSPCLPSTRLRSLSRNGCSI